MSRPQWIPGRAELPGLALSAVLGLWSLVIIRALPKSPFFSDVLIALALGAFVLNTPLRRAVGLAMPGRDREPDSYAPGVRFCGKWILRIGITSPGHQLLKDCHCASVFGAEP